MHRFRARGIAVNIAPLSALCSAWLSGAIGNRDDDEYSNENKHTHLGPSPSVRFIGYNHKLSVKQPNSGPRIMPTSQFISISVLEGRHRGSCPPTGNSDHTVVTSRN